MKSFSIFLCLLFSAVGLCANAGAQEQLQLYQHQLPLHQLPHRLESDQGMVVCDSPIASRIGRDVFDKGGNAVDAAVATAFAMAVTWPEAGNIGGGGFMMIRPADGQDPVCVDYRETAPLSARVDTFKEGEGTLSYRAVGVPGTVRGLELAHKKYGKLKWKELVIPAAEIAKSGFNVDQPLANSVNSILKFTNGKPQFAELHKVYGRPGGGQWTAGDTMKLPDLAATLARIANDGADSFYKGLTADRLVEVMKRENGMIRQADLDAYQAKIRKAVVGTFHGFEIIGAAPPSSGGTCLVQALNMVEALGVKSDDQFKPETYHLFAEVLRRVFLDRARHLGDPEFTKIPTHLTTKEYAKKLAGEIDREKASKSAELAPDIKLAYESDNTTHFSIVDPDGMAVSNTYTLEASWGSRMVVPGAGFVLNNEMGDFNWFKGVTNTRGRIGTDANLVAPGKRMLSSQCPVIVAKDGEVYMVTGSPGGRTIISTAFSVVMNRTLFGNSPAESVAAIRFHHQWMPDRFQIEWPSSSAAGITIAPSDFDKRLGDPLRKMGHKILRRSSQGSAHSIFIVDKKRIGVADARRSGRPAGRDFNQFACWDFGGSKGQQLAGLVSNGRFKSKWSSNVFATAKERSPIEGFSVDGNENLTIRKKGKGASSGYVVLGNSPAYSVKLHLSGVEFGGIETDEQVRVGFGHEYLGGETSGLNEPRINLEMVVERNRDGEIVVRGEALGSDAKNEAPYLLSETSKLPRLHALRLDANFEKERYSIWIRKPTSATFEKVIEGKIPPTKHGGMIAGILRLSAVNDFSDPGEYFKIDRLEVNQLRNIKDAGSQSPKQ